MSNSLSPRINLRNLLIIPSFYGSCVWVATLALYWMRLVKWFPDSLISIVVFLAVALCFVSATIFFLPYYKNLAYSADAAKDDESFTSNAAMPLWLLLMNVAGFAGIGIYLFDMSDYFGGLSNFFSTLLDTSSKVRQANSEIASLGTQIAYSGWIAAAITTYRVAHNRLNKGWLTIVLLQIAVNGMWVDRTRPMEIGFLCYAMYLLSRKNMTLLRTISLNMIALIASLVLFSVIGLWIGKIHDNASDQLDTSLPPVASSIYSYLTSPFAYCNDVLSNDTELRSVPYSITPLAKILVLCGLLDESPNPILEFRYVPYPTNVGTFLVIYYWDGGWLYLAFGILFYSFGLNFLGLWFLSYRNEFASLGWAIICWITCMAFFYPRIISTEAWLFLIVATCGVFMSVNRRASRFGNHENKQSIDMMFHQT